MIVKKEFNLENKFDLFIFGLIEGRISGDWNVYDDDEVIWYSFDLREEEWLDLDFNLESLENYIGDGIEYNGCEVIMNDYCMEVSWIIK